jgi:hypothetical protein
MDRRLRFVAAQMAWTYCAIFGLTLLGTLTFDSFFILSLIGFLVTAELTAPYTVRPPWRARLWWFVALGFAGFGYIVVRRLISLFPPGSF